MPIIKGSLTFEGFDLSSKQDLGVRQGMGTRDGRRVDRVHVGQAMDEICSDEI